MSNDPINAKFDEFAQWLRENAEEMASTGHQYLFLHLDGSESDEYSKVTDSELISEPNLCEFVVTRLVEIYKSCREDTYISVNQFMKAVQADVIAILKSEKEGK